MPKKSTSKENNSARIKMLEAAEQVFAEKGYDGARVDDIANRAGVNKVHLYYYFESKEQILKELIKANIEKASVFISQPFDSKTSFSQERFASMVNDVFEFLSQKADFFRILTIETLKTRSSDYSIFEILDPLHQKARDSVSIIGLTPDDNQIHSLVEHFFFDMSSLLLFFTLRDKFAEFYHLDEAELAKVFRDIYQRNMLKYPERIKRKITET